MAYILRVDDNRDCTVTLSALLKCEGHRVAVADNGFVALRLAAEEQFDLVLLDLIMPGMDGYEVARRLRNESHHPVPQIVALTGYRPSHQALNEELFDDYLLKPIEFERLESIVSGCTARAARSE